MLEIGIECFDLAKRVASRVLFSPCALVVALSPSSHSTRPPHRPRQNRTHPFGSSRMPRYAQTVAAPELIIEPEPAPSETVLKLRRDVRMAAVSQFINLFKRHVNLQFEITVSPCSPTLCTVNILCSCDRACFVPLDCLPLSLEDAQCGRVDACRDEQMTCRTSRADGSFFPYTGSRT